MRIWSTFNIFLKSLKVMVIIIFIWLENNIFKLQIFIKIFSFWDLFSRRVLINEALIQVNKMLNLSIFNHLVFLLDFIEDNKFFIFIFSLFFNYLIFCNFNIFILTLLYICSCSKNFQRTAGSYLINHFHSVLSIDVSFLFITKVILICLLRQKWF